MLICVCITCQINTDFFFFFSDYDFEVNFTTSSVLKFTPNWRQDGRRLFCFAYNPNIIQATEGSWAKVVTAIGRLIEAENEEERDGNLKSQSTTTTINAVQSKLLASDSLLLDIKCKWSSFSFFSFYITLQFLSL